MRTLTPLKIVSDNAQPKSGTGTVDKKEVIPYTKTALIKLGLPVKLIPTRAPLDESTLKTDISMLRPYQKEDVLLLSNRTTGAIFSEPRTGKTPTILSVVKVKELKKIIIICPTSIIYQWKDEVEKWTNLNAYSTPKEKPKRIEFYKSWTEGALVIGYELLRIDVTDILKNNKDIECIIIDEAHRMKNRNSQQTHAINMFKKIKNRFVLTGTPAPNKLHEVYCILNFLYPKIFTGYWRFIEYYFNYTESTNWNTKQTWTEIGNLKHPTELQEFIDRIAVRHTQEEAMPWLPDQDPPINIRLNLTKQQQRYISELQEMYETEDVIVDSDLTRLMRERQICNAPALLELKGKSPKIDWISAYLKDYPDTPTLIFSNFTQFLKLLSTELGIPHMIIGKTSKEKREQYKTMFQTGKIKVLLINIKAGKEGLTLDEAHVSIFCDTYPPSADVYQAEQRMTATTEDKSHMEKKLYRLMMKDSYDEKLYKVVEHNLSTTAVVNDYKNYLKNRR